MAIAHSQYLRIRALNPIESGVSITDITRLLFRPFPLKVAIHRFLRGKGLKPLVKALF